MTTKPVDNWSAEVGIPREEVGLLARVVRLNMLVTRVLDGLVEPHDVSVADYLVLASIGRGTSSPVELCNILGRTTGGMSLTIDRLVTAGWIARRADPADRRRIIVELTAAGRQTAALVNGALHEWEAALELTPATRQRIESHLEEVTDLVERPGADSPAR